MRYPNAILVVDDEANVRLMLQTTLESVGYHVSLAEDGEAALARLQSSDFDLVLLDLQMPKMGGMELLRRLRTAGNAIPVVFLSAHGSIPEAVEAMKLGAIDFLTKPITPDALRRAVADVVERHASDTAKPPPASPRAADRAKLVAFDLARAKRAINQGQFSEAEPLLREVIALYPGSSEAHELLDRLETLKEEEAHGSFRILRDWFPSGKTRGKS